MEKYVQVVYLQERKQKYAYFQIKYVDANISDKNIYSVLNSFQKSRGATRQQRHKVKVSQSQEFKDNVLPNVNKMIEESY